MVEAKLKIPDSYLNKVIRDEIQKYLKANGLLRPIRDYMKALFYQWKKEVDHANFNQRLKSVETTLRNFKGGKEHGRRN